MAIIKPPMVSTYKDFYIERGNAGADGLYASLGIVTKTNPTPMMPNAKEPYKNQWKDENGDDEYNGDLNFEAFETEYSFFMKAESDNNGSAVEYINNTFSEALNWLARGQFKFYDAYTGLGFQEVRYVGYETESFVERNGTARIIFKIKVKVNDPHTLMTLSNGHIIVAE